MRFYVCFSPYRGRGGGGRRASPRHSMRGGLNNTRVRRGSLLWLLPKRSGCASAANKEGVERESVGGGGGASWEGVEADGWGGGVG